MSDDDADTGALGGDDATAGTERMAGAARAASDAVSSVADYVRENDFKDMLGDLQQLIKDNPVPSLLAGAGLGFIVARALSRD